MRHTQLTYEVQCQIVALLAAEHDQYEMAMILGRHKSTISQEMYHNRLFKFNVDTIRYLISKIPFKGN